jgi:hypothetical protein
VVKSKAISHMTEDSSFLNHNNVNTRAKKVIAE